MDDQTLALDTDTAIDAGESADTTTSGITGLSATYSPDDNKLRLYAAQRLPRELYERVSKAGFKWAPKQELFVAPMWTPGREDLLLELCGEVADEDTSLVERAADRAERFEDYSDKRQSEGDAAHKAVTTLMDGIPLGQPILIGHHSERRARRDAERMQDGMRRAVKLWETSEYWQRRAEGALANARYKELPAVRARRIKTLEADKRKQERNKAEAAYALKVWSSPKLTPELALKFAGNHPAGHLRLPRKHGDRPDFDGRPSAYDALSNGFPNLYAPRTLEEIVAYAQRVYPPYLAHCDRWIKHYELRIAYERAMLAEAGGTVADRTRPEVGGGVRCMFAPRDGWAFITKVNKVTVSIRFTYNAGGRVFQQNVPFDKLKAVMSKDEVARAEAEGRLYRTADGVGFHLVEPERPKDDAAEPLPEHTSDSQPPAATPLDQMREQLRAGVQIVAAPQLFETPADLAQRLVELADIEDGHSVLEPSAGTGRLLDAILALKLNVTIDAVEHHQGLLAILRGKYDGVKLHAGDFLHLASSLPQFDRIVMNPPFADAADIRHVRCAFGLLRPGGKLAAIVAAGPRQQEQLGRLAAEHDGRWIPLPAGSFASSGTQVHTAIVTLTRPL